MSETMFPFALEPSLTKELISGASQCMGMISISESDPSPVFFAYCHPATILFHRPTFQYDLARSRIPPYLLLSMFALAAPWSMHAGLRTSPVWEAGEPYARIAMNEILPHDPTGRNSFNPPDSLDSLRIKPSLELAQTLCLLQIQSAVMRRGSDSGGWLQLALVALQRLDVLNLDMPNNFAAESFAAYVDNEAKRRALWLIFFIDKLSTAFTSGPSGLRGLDLNGLRLPIPEALFESPRIENRVGSAQHFDYLPFPPEAPAGFPAEQEKCYSEFANLLRISTTYSGVMDLVYHRRTYAAQRIGTY